MPVPGDQYTVQIKPSHIDWGEYRNTNTRNRIPGEGYVQIPREYAVQFEILRGDCFKATFSDGYPSFVARASGNTKSGDPYAKQFQGSGDLKAFGRWYDYVNAEVGDYVIVTFMENDIVNFQLERH